VALVGAASVAREGQQAKACWPPRGLLRRVREGRRRRCRDGYGLRAV